MPSATTTKIHSQTRSSKLATTSKSTKFSTETLDTNSSPPTSSLSQSLTTSSPSSLPSLKDLASSNPSLRRQALTLILTYLTTLPANHFLDATSSLQLWRGFSVCLYMHDSKSAVSVQNLISTLVGTVRIMFGKDVELLHSQNAAPVSEENGTGDHWQWIRQWTEAFWETISREWTGLDQWRMNKYLLLIRFFLRESLTSLFNRQLDQEAKESLLQTQENVLRKWPLSPKERKMPDGLRLHVLDCWVDEVERAKETAGSEAEASAEADHQNGEGGIGEKAKKRKRKTTDDGEQESKKKRSTVAKPESDLSDREVISRLMAIIRALSKEALGKGVKMKAKEIIKEYDAGQEVDS